MDKIIRRTFEAAKYPKGSPERDCLNRHVATSEYMPSYRYLAEGRQFRTKAEAVAFTKGSHVDNIRTLTQEERRLVAAVLVSRIPDLGTDCEMDGAETVDALVELYMDVRDMARVFKVALEEKKSNG